MAGPTLMHCAACNLVLSIGLWTRLDIWKIAVHTFWPWVHCKDVNCCCPMLKHIQFENVLQCVYLSVSIYIILGGGGWALIVEVHLEYLVESGSSQQSKICTHIINFESIFEPTCAHARWALMRRLLSVCAKILEKKSPEKNSYLRNC